ncbi:MAG: hypothetical protein GXO76_10965 [Calditrichaeota bacterium]|nr:hypothetical protein [Calditrichota bacterium]
MLISADSDTSALRQKSLEFFQEEIARRTGITLPVQQSASGIQAPAIWLTTDLKTLPADFSPKKQWQTAKDTLGHEGFLVQQVLWAGHPVLVVAANTNRGVLFGLGWLLRQANWGKGVLQFPSNLAISTRPATPIRGHQLAYRPLSNTYDAWTLRQYEQYIRDLIVFGTNTIELVVSARGNPKDQILMKQPPDKMNRALSRLIHSYGLDVSVWSDAADGDYRDPAQFKKALRLRERWFRSLPYIDDWFVPGGDPGHQPPEVLFAFLKKMALLLHRTHPNARLWVSNQGFDEAKNKVFFDYLSRVKPDWLTGVVYGPWTHLSLEEERARVPARYKIRRYPDITHSVRCQYPVPHWDRAYAIMENREPINPRPVQMAHIFRLYRKRAAGFVTYSEGVNDDVNKFVWSALGWNPSEPVKQILTEYSRCFILPDQAGKLAKGVFDLEKNWDGPIAKNTGIVSTLQLWQALADSHPALVRENWRFQQGLFRATYDAFVQRRNRLETKLEDRVDSVLRKASQTGVIRALEQASTLLQDRPSDDEIQRWEKQIVALGNRLNQTIGMQLSVPLHHAYNSERGALLDALDVSLNNREWLTGVLRSIDVLGDPAARLKAIRKVVNWEDAGPGGFYDDLGNAAKEPHLLPGKGWEADPGFVESAQDEFSGQPPQRLSWRDQAQTLYQTPLKLRYTGLDKGARYRLRVIYTGRFHATMSLTANDSIVIHGPLKQPRPVVPLVFDLPKRATRSGTLVLTWKRLSGRGCQVAEVWLEKR